METIETILGRLVAMPTVTADLTANHAALTFVAEYLAARGMSIAAYEQEGHRSIVATVRPNEQRPRIMLYAHIDVVAANAEQWHLTVREGRYYGRGVFDMKFALAVYLRLIDELQTDLASYDLGIMVVSDEEDGGTNGAGYLTGIGYRPEICVMPDSGENWNIETFAKGYLRLQLETFGVSAHGSRPWEGDNALVRLMALIHDIELLFPDNTNPDANTLNIGYIRGGESANQIPDRAEAGLDIRFISSEAEVLLRQAIRTICDQHDARLTVITHGPAIHTDINHPALQTFADIVTKVTGKKPLPHRAHGASDAGFFAEQGTTCIISTPNGGDRHAQTEWIDAHGVEQYYTVLGEYLETVARSRLKK